MDRSLHLQQFSNNRTCKKLVKYKLVPCANSVVHICRTYKQHINYILIVIVYWLCCCFNIGVLLQFKLKQNATWFSFFFIFSKLSPSSATEFSEYLLQYTLYLCVEIYCNCSNNFTFFKGLFEAMFYRRFSLWLHGTAIYVKVMKS